MTSPETDAIITIEPSKEYPETTPPLTLRFIKYTEDCAEYCLATSLTNPRYTLQALSHLHLERWSIEELYLTHKNLLKVFHSQSERGVRQERYACFILIALTRIFTHARCQWRDHG